MGATLTRKGLATRQRIVAGAAELFRARGVAGTSLDDVCEATSTSKSQLFHYFPDGRTQLLAAVAQHEADRVLEDQQPALDQLTSWAAWQAWRDRVVGRYRAQGQSCPLAVLTSQLGPGSPEHQEVVVGLFRRWQQKIADGIRSMQASGQIGPVGGRGPAGGRAAGRSPGRSADHAGHRGDLAPRSGPGRRDRRAARGAGTAGDGRGQRRGAGRAGPAVAARDGGGA